MTLFWTSRSPRERGLILLATGLLGLIILQFAVIAPLRAAGAQARLDLEAATRQLDVVTAELTAVAPQVAAGVPQASGETLRTGLLRLANARGLTVSRLQTGENGHLTLQFESAAPSLVYAWLAEAVKTYGAEPERVSMFAEEGGSVRASFEFAGRPS